MRWHYTGFVEGGRIIDSRNNKMKTALREIAKVSDGDFILTGNQNVIFAGVSGRVKSKIDQILRDFGVFTDELSGLRKNSIACTALPTCPLHHELRGDSCSPLLLRHGTVNYAGCLRPDRQHIF